MNRINKVNKSIVSNNNDLQGALKETKSSIVSKKARIMGWIFQIAGWIGSLAGVITNLYQQGIFDGLF